MSGTGIHEFCVLSNEWVTQDIWHMTCQTEVAQTIVAGQFVNIHVPGDDSHILRIPLSFSCADAQNNTLQLVYAVVGEGTERLSHMRPGDTSTMVGPCGNGWHAPKEPGRALLVAGGVGLPPVVACARMLTDLGIGYDAIVGSQTGARHIDFLLDELRGMAPTGGCDCARKVIITTDDGTRGIHGFTTSVMQNMLAENSYATAYTCGPQAMMAGVAQLADKVQMECQVSMERMMGCGFGACSCCNVALRSGGYALCCTDGPVFDAKEVLW